MNPRHPANQHVPYPARKESIQKLYKIGKDVHSKNFNEITLTIGSIDFTTGSRPNVVRAFVMFATLGRHAEVNLGRLFDIGLIISMENMVHTYPDVGPICLPKRFIIVLRHKHYAHSF